jgi:hypothetical protein
MPVPFETPLRGCSWSAVNYSERQCRNFGAETSSADAALLFDSVTFLRSLREFLKELLVLGRTESFVDDESYSL